MEPKGTPSLAAKVIVYTLVTALLTAVFVLLGSGVYATVKAVLSL